MTRQNVGQLDAFKAIADRSARSCGSPGCGRPAAAPTSGTSCTSTAAAAARALRLAGRARRERADRRLVLPPGRLRRRAAGAEPVRRRAGGLPDRPGGRRLRLPVRDPRELPGRQRARAGRVRRRVARRRSCSPAAQPQSGGACTSCSAYDACRGGCMAAKFFTGLPLDGPDPECVKGHGETALAAHRPRRRATPVRSTTRTGCVPLTRAHRAGDGVRPEPAGPASRHAVAASRSSPVPRAASAPRPCARWCAGWSVVAVDRGRDDPALPYPLATRGRPRGARRRRPVHPVVADVRDAARAGGRGGRGRAALRRPGRGGRGRRGDRRRVPQWQLPAEQERVVLDVNLVGVLNLARAAVPALLRRPQPRGGRFLAVASAAATRGMPIWPPTARRRPAWPVWFARWPPSSAAPASPRTRSAPARPPPRSSTRAPGCTGWDSPRSSPRSSRSAGCSSPDEVAAVLAFLAGPGGSGDHRRGRPGRRRHVDMTDAAVRPASGSSSTRREAAGRRVVVRRLAAAGRAAHRGRAGRRGPSCTRTAWSTAAPDCSPAGSSTPASRIPSLRRPGPPIVTVVVPAHDRPDDLARCLAALGTAHPRRGRRRRARPTPTASPRCAATTARRWCGARPTAVPAAARNTGLAHVAHRVRRVRRQRLPAAAWLARAAARALRRSAGRRRRAARVRLGRGHLGRTVLARAEQPRPRRRARPGGAAHAGRVRAERGAGRAPSALDGGGFDEALRVGEDVDLVWRLHAAGARIRYVASVEVPHREPRRWACAADATLPLRHLGGSAGPPAPRARSPRWCCTRGRRSRWPRRSRAVRCSPAPPLRHGAAPTARTLRAADSRPRACCRRPRGRCSRPTLGLGRYATQFALPLLVAGLPIPACRAFAASALLLGPPAPAWAPSRRRLDPLRFTLGMLADEFAYGAGVWTGSVRSRTAAPLRPVVAWRPLRIDAPRS